MIRLEYVADLLRSSPLQCVFKDRLYTQVHTNQVELHLDAKCTAIVGAALTWDELVIRWDTDPKTFGTPSRCSITGCAHCGTEQYMLDQIDFLVAFMDGVKTEIEDAAHSKMSRSGLIAARCTLDDKWVFVSPGPWIRHKRNIELLIEDLVLAQVVDVSVQEFAEGCQRFFQQLAAQTLNKSPLFQPQKDKADLCAVVVHKALAVDLSSTLYRYSPLFSAFTARDGYAVFEVPRTVASRITAIAARWNKSELCSVVTWDDHRKLLSTGSYNAVLHHALEVHSNAASAKEDKSKDASLRNYVAAMVSALSV